MRGALGLLVATACTAVRPDPVVALPAAEGSPCLGAYVIEDGDTLAALASRFAFAGGGSALAERNGIVAPQPTFGTLEASLHRVDLDGDADDEVVVVHYVTTSNGIALMHWRVFVADEIGEPPASFHAHAVRFVVADSRGCDLVAEDFVAIDDPITGRGNYFVERRLGWSAGSVVPQDERLRAQRLTDTPPELRREPALDGVLVWSLPGTIVAVRADDGGTVVVDHGLVKVEYGARSWRSDFATYVGLGWHGDAVLLPPEYSPVHETDWIGRRVHVEARLPYVGAIEAPTHVLRIAT